MSDLEATVAPAVIEEKFEPASASLDGRRNAYTLGCLPTGQSMNYASCCWRQSLIGAKPRINVPADWSGCIEARSRGSCVAVGMREEEVLQDKAIYFTPRNLIITGLSTARKWIMPIVGKRAEPKPAAAPVSMFDALGSAGDYTDAIKAVASAPVRAPEPPRPIPAAKPGESPLDIARRLAIERSINT